MDCKDLHSAEAGELAAGSQTPVRVLAAVSDLMFVAKISAAARQAGCPVEFFREASRLLTAAAAGACVILLDLNNSALDGVDLIRQLKSCPHTQEHPVIAFLSHVQHDLKREAEKAGADLVLPRSVFSQNLYDILRRRSCHL